METNEKKWPYNQPQKPFIPFPDFNPPKQETITINWPTQISKEEFEALKKDVQEMKELLKRAKIYDEKNNEPNCEIEDKMKTLRAIAKVVGIDLDDVLRKQDESRNKKDLLNG